MITVAPYNDTVLLCCQRRCLSLWHALRESLSFSFVTFENLSCSYWFNVIFLFCSSSFFFFLHLLLLLPPLPLPPPPPPSSSSSSFLLLLPLSTPLCAPPSPAPLVSLIFFSSFFFFGGERVSQTVQRATIVSFLWVLFGALYWPSSAFQHSNLRTKNRSHHQTPIFSPARDQESFTFSSTTPRRSDNQTGSAWIGFGNRLERNE